MNRIRGIIDVIENKKANINSAFTLLQKRSILQTSATIQDKGQPLGYYYQMCIFHRAICAHNLAKCCGNVSKSLLKIIGFFLLQALSCRHQAVYHQMIYLYNKSPTKTDKQCFTGATISKGFVFLKYISAVQTGWETWPLNHTEHTQIHTSN